MAGILRTSLATGLGVGTLSIVVPVGIWPGEAKLTAPLFCSPPYREPMVVADTMHDSDGTSTNYTLYCVSDRGAFTDSGFLLPFLVILAVHVLVIAALTAIIARMSRTPAESPAADRVEMPTEDHTEH